MILVQINFILVRKCKDCHKSFHLVLPKTKEGRVGIRESEASLLLENKNGEVDYLTDDLQNSNTNAVTASESYQACIVYTSLIPMKESELPFDCLYHKTVNFNWTYLPFSHSTALTLNFMMR
jgi:hypothetical protein